MLSFAVVVAISLVSQGQALALGGGVAGVQGTALGIAGPGVGFHKTVAHTAGVAPGLGFAGALGGHGFGVGGFHGFGVPGLAGVPFAFGAGAPKKEDKVQLSGYRSMYDDNAIGVVVKEGDQPAGYGSPFGLGPFAGAFGGLKGAFGGHAQGRGGGLEMVVDIVTDFDSKYPVFIALTKYAGVDPKTGQCTAKSVGPVVQPERLGGFGKGGFPTHAGFAHQGLFGAFPGAQGGYDDEDLPAGVVAEVVLDRAYPTTINIKALDGFNKLEEIAGRGVIACTKFERNYNGEYVCVGKVLACVGLTYELVPEKKHGYADPHDPHDPHAPHAPRDPRDPRAGPGFPPAPRGYPPNPPHPGPGYPPQQPQPPPPGYPTH